MDATPKDLQGQAADLVERLRRAPAAPEVLLAVARFEARSEQPLAAGDLRPPAHARGPLQELLATYPELHALGRMLADASLEDPQPASTVVWRELGGRWRLTLVQERASFRIPDPEAGDPKERFRLGWRTWRLSGRPWYTPRRSVHFGEGRVSSISSGYRGKSEGIGAVTWKPDLRAWELSLSYTIEHMRDVDYWLRVALRPASGTMDLIEMIQAD